MTPHCFQSGALPGGCEVPSRGWALAFCDMGVHVSCGLSRAARSTMGGAFVSLLTWTLTAVEHGG